MSDDTNTVNEEPAGTQSASASTPTDAGQPPSFLDGLAPDLKSSPSLQNFKDVNSLAKSYVEAQSLIGKSIRLPSENASPEELASFYDKIGRPKTPDEYKLASAESPLIDKNQLKEFTTIAHQLGLTNSQVDALVKFEATRTMKIKEAMDASQIEAEAKAEQAISSCEKALKDAWGVDYDNRLAAAKELRDHFGSKYGDAVKELFSVAGNNPVLGIMAAELGRAYKESGIILGNRPNNFGMTPDEARSKINEIRSNPTHAYYNDKDPGHKAARDQMERLYQAAYPEPQNQ